jgi:hypothetical protein
VADEPPADVAALAQAYYAREVQKPDAARARAQAGFGVASAIGTVLSAIGFFADPKRLDPVTVVLGAIAVGGWFVAAGLYLWAISYPGSPTGQQEEIETVDQWKWEVLKTSTELRKQIDNRVYWAMIATWVALFMTLSALLATLIVGPRDSREVVAAAKVDPASQEYVSSFCAQAIMEDDAGGSYIIGEVNPSDSQTTFVEIELPEGKCHGELLVLPKASVDRLLTLPQCSLNEIYSSSKHTIGLPTTASPLALAATSPSPPPLPKPVGSGFVITRDC